MLEANRASMTPFLAPGEEFPFEAQVNAVRQQLEQLEQLEQQQTGGSSSNQTANSMDENP